jgi:hypothetical protein
MRSWFVMRGSPGHPVGSSNRTDGLSGQPASLEELGSSKKRIMGAVAE